MNGKANREITRKPMRFQRNHQNINEVLKKSMKFQRCPKSMEIHRIRWQSIESDVNPWKSLEFHGNRSDFKAHGMPWHSTDTHGIPRPNALHGNRWNPLRKSMEFQNPCTSTDFHGIPWNAIEIYRNPWKMHGNQWILMAPGIPWISRVHGMPLNSIEIH